MPIHNNTTDYLNGLKAELFPLARYVAEPHWSDTDRFFSGLLRRILATESTSETSLLSVRLPGFALGANFNEVLLYTLAVVKYIQNYEAAQLSPYMPQVGDLVYRKNDLFVVKGPKGALKWGVSLLFPRKGENGIREAEFKEPVKLFSRQNYNYQPRATAERLNECRTFFRAKLNNENLPLLSEFKHRSVVLAEGELWQINNSLPLRYRNNDGESRAHHLPIQPMIESCGSVGVAVEHILNNDQYFDEVIVVGASRYRDNLPVLIDKYNRGKIGRLVLIGDESVPEEYGFKTWEMTATEIQLLRQHSIPDIRIQKVDAPQLLCLVDEYERLLKKYREEHSIDLSDCLAWVRPYLWLAIPAGQERDECLRYFRQRNEGYLCDEEWEERWYTAGLYDSEKIAILTDAIRNMLARIHGYFQHNNPKWDYLNNQIAHSSINKVWVAIGHEQQAAAFVDQEMIKGVATKRWNSQSVPHLGQWAKNPKRQLSANEGNQLFVPGLSKNSFQLLDHLSLLTIPTNILSYTGLEEGYPEYILRSYLHSEIAKVTHPDRYHWTGCRLEIPTPPSLDFINPARIEELFSIDTSQPILRDKENNYDWEIQPCRIRFSDKSSYDTHRNRRVELLLKGGVWKMVVVGSLMAGDRIRYYHNNDSDTFDLVVETLDSTGLCQQIKAASKCWRKALLDLYVSFYGDEERLYRKLKEKGYQFSQNMLHNYLMKSNSTRFPNSSTLKAIHELSCQYLGGEANFVKEYSQVLLLKSKDKSLRQSIGSGLGNELLEFESSNCTPKGPILERLNMERKDLIYQLIESIQEKTVESITDR